MSVMSAKIYGCRGSIPVTGPNTARYGGETSCLVVKTAERTLVFDAGSGIRQFGIDLNTTPDPRLNIFFSHSHFDHVQGLPYFNPIYRPDATINLFGPRDHTHPSFEATLSALIRPPFHPVSMFEMLSRKRFYDMGEAHTVYFLKGEEDPIQVRPLHPDDRAKIPPPETVEVVVKCMRGYNHPKSGVNIYRIEAGGKAIVYATDTEGYVDGDRRLVNFAQNADLLFHDAMYTSERYISMPTQGYGHSTVEIACGMAKHANVKQLVLWHHDPISTDADLDKVGELATTVFENSIVGSDGLEIEL